MPSNGENSQMELYKDGPMSVKVIAEIGINHNGDLDTAVDLIRVASSAGCDFVKFQKRVPDLCIPDDQKEVLRDTPWGRMTYLDYKKKIEFGQKEYDYLFELCNQLRIGCFASVWDIPSSDFMRQYTAIAKIPSAKLTDFELCRRTRKIHDFVLSSTGMSTEEEIHNHIMEHRPDVVFHTNSTYPSPVKELQLNYIYHLTNISLDLSHPFDVGYSGHEYGLVTTFATIPMGVRWIERHITLDRNMWGSDQKASIEPSGLFKLVKGIREIELALGPKYITKRRLFESELNKRNSLRG